jgi:hypothetical protein
MVAQMTYRTIDIEGREVIPAEVATRPQLIWLRIADLIIDDRFQRQLNDTSWRQIERIAKAFTWSHFSPVLVAPVGERFSIIDGQHRTHAAKLVGLSEVPAMLLDLDDAGQARAFAAVNGMATAVSATQVYKAALLAGEKWAVEAEACVEKAGAQLMTYNASAAKKKPGEVYCIGWVRDQIESGRGELLTRALAAINRSGQRADMFLWSYPFLKAWMVTLRAVPKATRVDLAAFLDVHPPTRLEKAVYLLKRGDDPMAREKSHGFLFQSAQQAQLEAWVGAA